MTQRSDRGGWPAKPFHEWFPSWVYPASLFILIVVGWQAIVTWLRVPNYILPTPTAIADSMGRNFAKLNTASMPTIEQTFWGFVLAVVVGVPVSALIVGWGFFEKAFYPIVVVIQSIPRIVAAPFFVLWFGFGPLPKVFVAFLACFFPVIVDGIAGFRATEPRLVDLLRSMGASNAEIFFKLRVYRALPHIFAGIKVATSLAIIGAVVAEFVGSKSGLGFVLLTADTNLQTSLIFGDIVYLSVFAFVFYWVFEFIERKAIPWHVSQRRLRTSSR